jgi:hypothetical protein
MARYGSGSPGWCVARYRSRRTWPTISVLSSTSFVITISPKVQPYLDSTPGSLLLSVYNSPASPSVPCIETWNLFQAVLKEILAPSLDNHTNV